MSCITFHHQGNFSKTYRFFERALHLFKMGEFDRYGKMGVEALREMTPKDSGITARSWYYDVHFRNDGVQVSWSNNSKNEGYNIAILVQYGHATRNGAFVQGVDYINPAMQPLFQQMADEIWKEVTTG